MTIHQSSGVFSTPFQYVHTGLLYFSFIRPNNVSFLRTQSSIHCRLAFTLSLINRVDSPILQYSPYRTSWKTPRRRKTASTFLLQYKCMYKHCLIAETPETLLLHSLCCYLYQNTISPTLVCCILYNRSISYILMVSFFLSSMKGLHRLRFQIYILSLYYSLVN